MLYEACFRDAAWSREELDVFGMFTSLVVTRHQMTIASVR